MKDLLAPFREVVEDRHGFAARWKEETGGKIAGYFCDYVPEELLWAAGYATVRITAGRGNVSAAERYLQSNVCSFARRCLDQALEGVYDYLDALVIPHTCDVITKMYDLWAYRIKDPPFLHYLWVPHKVYDKDAFGVMLGEVKRLKKSLEEHIGEEITEESLREAISLYNRSRALLQKVEEARSASPARLSGEEAFMVSLSALLAPKDLHVEWTESLLASLPEGSPALDGRPRVLIAASVLDDLELVHAVEQAGAHAVSDDVCTGTRYFMDLVEEEEEDPLSALTRRYLNKLPCPRSVGSLAPRLEHLLARAKAGGASGVIFYILRCCDAHLYQYPLLKDRLEKEGIKTLYLQGDQVSGLTDSHKNRIQAFVEMLES